MQSCTIALHPPSYQLQRGKNAEQGPPVADQRLLKGNVDERTIAVSPDAEQSHRAGHRILKKGPRRKRLGYGNDKGNFPRAIPKWLNAEDRPHRFGNRSIVSKLYPAQFPTKLLDYI